jgi:hypothetical protein
MRTICAFASLKTVYLSSMCLGRPADQLLVTAAQLAATADQPAVTAGGSCDPPLAGEKEGAIMVGVPTLLSGTSSHSRQPPGLLFYFILVCLFQIENNFIF